MTTPEDGPDGLAWRNAAADWHLSHGLPGCGCDDDTPDADLCGPSRDHADRVVALIDGPPDAWTHDSWVDAWGANLPLVVSGHELHGVPPAPAGTAWLATRLLTSGHRAVELALLRLGENGMTTLERVRSLPDPAAVARHARAILQRFSQ